MFPLTGQQFTARGREFLREVAEAFEASPLEIGIFLMFLLGLGGLITVVTVFQARRAHAKLARVRKARFDAALSQAGLSPSQAAALDHILDLLPDRSQAVRVLESEGLFHALARSAMTRGQVSGQQVSALRRRLPFERRSSSLRPRSTANLVPGQRLFIDQRRGKPIEAQLQDVAPNGLVLLSERQLHTGGCRLIVSSAEGLYYFATRVVSIEGRQATLIHSERSRRVQKRHWVRREVALPIVLQLEAGQTDEKGDPGDTGILPEIPCELIDIGGGGMSMRPGPELTMTIAAMGEGPCRLRFRVMIPQGELTGVACIVDAGPDTVRLRFEALREPERERIVRYCLTGKWPQAVLYGTVVRSGVS